MKALVLAGGFPQIELIKNLKNRNIEVVVADYNEEPIAKKYADKFAQISTLDIDAIRRLAVDEEVDFLITVCTDQALHTVAKVSEDLGLPCYIDYQTAQNVTNKQHMKKVFVEYHIPTARHVVLNKFDEAAIAAMRYPLIVKPVDCNSSKGVRRCENIVEVKEYFKEAVCFSRTNTAVIEEFIEGEEISVDVYVEDGKAHVLCISKSEKIADKDKFVIFRALYPAAISAGEVSKIEIIAQQIAEAFNIKNSPMLIQILSDGDNVFVIEFSARSGGGVKYLLIKRVSGFDVIDAVIELTLGNRPHVAKSQSQLQCIVNDFIYCYPGKFDHLEGFEELLSEGMIKDYYLFKWRGAEFSEICASGDRIAGYTITAYTPEEIIKKHKVVRNSIKVISDTGEDMARHDLLTSLYTENGFLYSKEKI